VANFVEFRHFVCAERLFVAEKVRNERDLGEVLDGFHAHVGALERRPEGDDSVIRHEDGIVAGVQGRR